MPCQGYKGNEEDRMPSAPYASSPCRLPPVLPLKERSISGATLSSFGAHVAQRLGDYRHTGSGIEPISAVAK